MPTIKVKQNGAWEEVTYPMKKLTFTGAVNAEYDGSAEVSVEIPEGGGCDFRQYGLGVTANPLSLSNEYELDSVKETGWYSVTLAYGNVDFGDGWTSNAFSLRVETGACAPYDSVTKQTAMFATYPGAMEYYRYCKGSSGEWSAWQSAKAGGGGVSRVLLWENADSMSEFPKQTIRNDRLSEYDAIEVMYIAGGYPGGYGSCYMSSGVLPKIAGTELDGYYVDGYALNANADYYNGANTQYYRLFEWGIGYITFEDGQSVDYYNGSAIYNYACVPVRIYGIKGVESL